MTENERLKREIENNNRDLNYLRCQLFDKDLELLKIALDLNELRNEIFYVDKESKNTALIYSRYGFKIYLNVFNHYIDIVDTEREEKKKNDEFTSY